MNREQQEITDVESLRKAILELEGESKMHLINIRLKSDRLKENFFLKTDLERYNFNKGQEVAPELLKLFIRNVLRPNSLVSGTLGTLVSTFVVQKFGKKITKQFKKLLKNILP